MLKQKRKQEGGSFVFGPTVHNPSSVTVTVSQSQHCEAKQNIFEDEDGRIQSWRKARIRREQLSRRRRTKEEKKEKWMG